MAVWDVVARSLQPQGKRSGTAARCAASKDDRVDVGKPAGREPCGGGKAERSGQLFLNGYVLSCGLAAERDKAEAFPLVKAYVVGATGFEPVTSSVSAKHREPLCYPPFSQVGSDRRCGRETLS